MTNARVRSTVQVGTVLRALLRRTVPVIAAVSLTSCLGAGDWAENIGIGSDGVGGSHFVNLGDRTASDGDYRSALTFYRQALDANPGRISAMIGMGRSFEGLGQFGRAERSLRPVLEREPDNEEAALLLGRVLLQQDRPQEALELFDRVRRNNPSQLRAYLGAGVALDSMGNHLQAQDAYRAGLEIDPVHLSLLNNMALSLAFSGRSDEAIGILRELVSDPSSSSKVVRNLALIYVLADRRDAAAATLATYLPSADVADELAYLDYLSRNRRSL